MWQRGIEGVYFLRNLILSRSWLFLVSLIVVRAIAVWPMVVEVAVAVALVVVILLFLVVVWTVVIVLLLVFATVTAVIPIVRTAILVGVAIIVMLVMADVSGDEIALEGRHSHLIFHLWFRTLDAGD